MPAALLNNQMVVATASWAYFHRTLLATARGLLPDGHLGPALALTLAHTAAEVFAERTCAAWVTARGIVAQPVPGIPSNNLATPRVRKRYTALTGDPIGEQQSFWQAFVVSRDLRDAFVHGGAAVTREQAEAGCTAVDRLLDHLEQIHEQAVQQVAARPSA